MPQMINNLELELKRHRLNLEFIRMIDLDSQSQISNSVDNVGTGMIVHDTPEAENILDL